MTTVADLINNAEGTSFNYDVAEYSKAPLSREEIMNNKNLSSNPGSCSLK